MSKRKKPRLRKAYLKRFSSDYINVLQGPNPAKLAEYHERVRSATGPKNAMMPLMSHSFNQAIIEGKMQEVMCSCGKGPFNDVDKWTYHYKKAFDPWDKEYNLKHEPQLRNLNRINTERRTEPTPLQETIDRKKKLENEPGYWSWVSIATVRTGKVYLGCRQKVWKFKKELGEDTTYSAMYNTKELAIYYWNLGLVRFV